MELKNYTRNEFGKTDTPENTMRHIADGLDTLGYDIQYTPFPLRLNHHSGIA